MSKGLKTIACLKILRGAIAITIGISLYLVYRNSGVFSWIDHPELSSMASKDPFLQVLFFGWGTLIQSKYLALLSWLALWAYCAG